MEKADIGLIGLGVMGQNLALNLAGKGWKVAVWNRTVPGKEEHIVDNFIAKRAQGKSIVGTQTLEEFVDALKTPKVVFLMVQAGSAVNRWNPDRYQLSLHLHRLQPMLLQLLRLRYYLLQYQCSGSVSLLLSISQ